MNLTKVCKRYDNPMAASTNATVSTAGVSAAGLVRNINQDAWSAARLPDGRQLLAVADGLGGHQAGEVASKRAIELLERTLARGWHTTPWQVAKAVQLANQELQAITPGAISGTTLTTVVIEKSTAFLAHAGDSRAYLFRHGRLEQLTQDHSWVAEQERQGTLSANEARQHRWRNIISNALGVQDEVRLDVQAFPVQLGDRIILLSDGVFSLLDEPVITGIAGLGSAEAIAQRFVEEANRRGSPDNVTAVVGIVSEAAPGRPQYRTDGPATTFTIGAGTNVMSTVEDAFPRNTLYARLRRHPYFLYRWWALGSALLFIILILALARVF